MNNPLVSVLMPAYNAEKYISEAIESILSQTYKNFELVIVNDGSEDQTENIIKSFQDKRIKYVNLKKNKGISEARNKCLELAQGKYLANLDSDDIALPTRLEKQVIFMKKNPNIAVCGSFAQQFGDTESLLIYPENSHQIKINLFFLKAWFCNSATMMRAKSIKNLHYDENYIVGHDYHFWVKLIEDEFANLPEILVKYRTSQTQITQKKQEEMWKETGLILENQIKNFIDNPSQEEINLHINYCLKKLEKGALNLKKLELWFEKILNTNSKKQRFYQKTLETDICQKWFVWCNKNSKFGLKVFWVYYKSSLKKYYPIGKKNTILFFLDCLLKRESSYLNNGKN